MNLAKILKNCPKGTKLYSPLCGEIELVRVKDEERYPITCCVKGYRIYNTFTSDGRFFSDYPHAECVLFPSKDQRDWSKFVVPDTVPDKESDQSHKFKSFDKVLVRDDDDEEWMCNLFSCLDEYGDYVCVGSLCPWKQCIPYEGNEHLVGTSNKPE